MDRTVLAEPRSRRNSYTLWVAAVVVVAVIAGLTWLLVQNGAPEAMAGDTAGPALDGSEAVAPPAAVTGMREPDAYSIQLDELRRHAASVAAVAASDSATAYGVSLEALARTGRETYVASRLPVTVNGYVTYLEGLRQLGQDAQGTNGLPADPNAYSAWLDELRRLGQ